MEFRKATKEQAKLRLALFGPSGSGKTFTALRLAAGMGGRIAVIDTERGSASKYADRFEFDVLELGNGDRAIEGYIAGIKVAQEAGYNILIIDSLSHAWKELLEEIDRLASKFGGNKWAAWSKGTPKQNSFVDAILDYDGHIIATMRSKTAWDTSKDSRGRVKPVRVGLEPVQGKGIEYEFDLLGELSIDHVLHISKDRTGKFQDRIIEKPGEEMGKELMEWLSSGEPPKKRKSKKRKDYEAKFNDLYAKAIALEIEPEMLPTITDEMSLNDVTKAGKAIVAIIDGATSVEQITESPIDLEQVSKDAQADFPPETKQEKPKMWYKFAELAVKELKFNAPQHVANALRKILDQPPEFQPFNNETGEIIGIPDDLWTLLKDHQAAKLES